jgi:hydroxymethylpyrimidine pyrophosphatase-like HAD family hydrolase
VDLPFLKRVGHSAAPSNANASVAGIVDYLAPQPTASGVRDILAHYGLLP